MKRNSDGSKKEYEMLENVFEKIDILCEVEIFTPSEAVKILNEVVNLLKDLKERKYVWDFNVET